ncbi:MAG: potassium channel protein [Bacteroidales bacterium]|nr:MAG: potassium channel protein [Bacteroidales bacterium]
MKNKGFRSIVFPVTLLVLVILIGNIGFMIIEGFSPMESFFMTIITISTVGFQEVRPLSEAGRLFTAFLIIFSLGIFGYVVTNVTRFIVDGIFRNYYKDNKVKKRIHKLNNHVILCGYGRNGKQAAIELLENEELFVIIESSENLIEKIREETSLLYINGDATQEDILWEAGIKKAKALITTLPNDADNLLLVITARQINPGITIISRASDDKSDVKLKRAGANNVIMSDKIGGQRMAKLVTQPDVVEFLEYIMLQRKKDVSLNEVSCKNLSSCFADKSIRQLDVRNVSGANIVGLKRPDKTYIINPDPEIVLTTKDQLFVLGTGEQITRLKEIIDFG